MSFRDAVENTPAVASAWRNGLHALRRADSAHVRAETPRLLTGSVDIDGALEADYHGAPRWDYAVGHRPRNMRAEIIYWIEIHPANDRGVDEVLKKLAWLKKWLTSARALGKMRREFIWVSSGRTSFTPLSPQQKQFAALGLQHKGRVFTIPDEAAA
ncbi:MAG: hypothetical protein ACLQLG_00270 [Thermoguttaceae bacterium]